MIKSGNYYYLESDEDCAECLCRVCARNSSNDSWNNKLEYGYKGCVCDCEIGSFVIVTKDDCSDFLPDEG